MNNEQTIVYWPKRPGEKTRCSDCINDDENCWECSIDDLLDARREIDE